MGSITSKLISPSHQARILLLGMDSAGKTTVLYQLKLQRHVKTTPTIGFNVESLSPTRDVTITVWDVGGEEKIRGLWRHHYHGAHGVIFVVDSTDVERMAEARRELWLVLKDEGLAQGVPVAVFANKQDLHNAMTSAQMQVELGLVDLEERKWFIQEMSAASGIGVNEGLTKMADLVKEFQSGCSLKCSSRIGD